MRPPAFWQQKPGLLAWALWPLGALYAAATARRLKGIGYCAAIPVICIGNLNAGGTGKTPTAIALLLRLSGKGLTCHVVTRGHGGSLIGPVLVDPNSHSADQTGDEPLLMAAFAPTWVAKDRAAGVREAEAAGAHVILLDDGFQNPGVVKDLSLVVVDAERGFGNGFCLPAGPLREPVKAGLRRADLVLSIGTDEAQQGFDDQWAAQITQPRLRGRIEPLRMGMDWQGQRVLAFAGIGYPEKFFASLRAEGAQIVKAVALDDHQPLTDSLLRRLAGEAAALDAQLVTTEKDQVRLPPAYRQNVLAMVVRLHITDWGPLDLALAKLGLWPQTKGS
ncbi:MAG: tetraacyldisaccharide 4'-kinase [Rhodobacteraceae bacterium]|nr:tetraacyldisaccharide 4'-kinase [Paracoccaceae bacterium]MCF8515710.1 tetraacyldisaccharide 4'-kinase [Paracoccaceae bacterium]MCF8519955.1 tetraacyldisaccharide 4'-kinase [Paracoccaceae bacterium]